MKLAVYAYRVNVALKVPPITFTDDNPFPHWEDFRFDYVLSGAHEVKPRLFQGAMPPDYGEADII